MDIKNFAVGQKWRDGYGNIIPITFIADAEHGVTYPVHGRLENGDTKTFTLEGKYMDLDSGSNSDLVELVDDEQAEIALAKPALAVGQKWRQRDGDVVTIAEDRGNGFTYRFIDDAMFTYTSSGEAYAGSVNGLDLVELVEDVAITTPSLDEIRSSAADDNRADALAYSKPPAPTIMRTGGTIKLPASVEDELRRLIEKLQDDERNYLDTAAAYRENAASCEVAAENARTALEFFRRQLPADNQIAVDIPF
jgi:hypothetical protein